MEQYDSRIILVVAGALILLTAIVTENLKKVFVDTVPPELLAVLVAEGLTLVPGFACAQILKTTILWYHVLAAVVAGYGVACVAMFSYDKARAIWRKLRKNKSEKLYGRPHNRQERRTL